MSNAIQQSCYRYSYSAHLDPGASFYESQYFTSPDLSVFQIREILLLYYMFSGYKFIHGHFPFSQLAYSKFSKNYAFLTILRNPIDRFISEYYYIRFGKGSHRHDKGNMEISEYLDSDYGKLQGTQYVRFLIGNDLKDDPTSQFAIEQAKENLAKFTLVGCLEDQELFLKKFKQKFGRQLHLKYLNTNPRSKIKQKEEISPQIRKNIQIICQPDMEIYDYAVNHLIKN